MLCAAAANDVKATAVALNDDDSLLIVRVSHSQLADVEELTEHDNDDVLQVGGYDVVQLNNIISWFVVVDVASGQSVGTVGEPCHGAAPATAEYVDDIDRRILVVTCSVLSHDLTGICPSVRLSVCLSVRPSVGSSEFSSALSSSSSSSIF